MIRLFDSPNILSIMTCSKVEMYPKNEKPIKSPKEPPNDPMRLISSKIRISSNTSTTVDAKNKLNWTFMFSVPLSRSCSPKSFCSTLVVYCLKLFWLRHLPIFCVCFMWFSNSGQQELEFSRHKLIEKYDHNLKLTYFDIHKVRDQK